MKHLSIATLLLIAMGCGGGGGVPIPPGGGGPSTPQQLAEQVLQDCGLDGINRLFEVIALVEGTVDAGLPLPTFNLTSVDKANFLVTWELDVDSDGQVDIVGSFRFDDGQGGFPAVDLTPLDSGSQNLPNVLATMPDGSIFTIEFNITGDTNVFGGVGTTYQSGAANTASGQVEVQGGACGTSINFMDVPTADLFAGEFPTAAFQATIAGDGGQLVGTLTFDGTEIVLIDVTLDGADAFTFELDTASGILTLVP